MATAPPKSRVPRDIVTVGIDVGTTSVKGIAVDEAGNVLARTRVPHGFISTRPDQLEHDARRAWRLGPRRAMRDLGAVAAGAAGVCVSAMVPSLTAVDRRGIPLGPGVLYGDGRGANDSGLPDPLGEFPALVGWAASAFPAARGFWPAQAVASVALGGEAVVDTSVAGAGFPLFDGEGWDAAAAAVLGTTTGHLPRIVGTGEAAGRLPNGGVIASGVVDGMAEQMCAGADRAGDVLVLLGATLITWAVGPQWQQVEGLMTLPVGNGNWSTGGPSNAGGLFVEWVRAVCGDGPVATGAGDPAAVPVWLPFLRGERAPVHDRTKRAALVGLHSGHDAPAIRRAAFEASGFVVRSIIELSGVDARRIVATGGGTNALPWVQALADATQLPVDVVAVAEGAALGAAFVARVAAGLEGSLDDSRRWARTARTVEPNASAVTAVDERYQIFRHASR